MSEAPNDLWLHKLTEQVDEPYQWQLTERRIDKHSVRYVLADLANKRIAELEADCKHWKAVAYEFGPSEADNAFLDG